MSAKWKLIPICLLCAAMLQALTIGAQPVTKIAAGGGHSLFIKGDGSLWAVGYRASGQLGDGGSLYGGFRTNWPEQIVAGNITAICGGGLHTLFLKSDGSLWAMGDNRDGQLGDGTYNDVYPYSGTNRPEQIVLSNVTAIAAGDFHSLFLKSDGSLWAMGWNVSGQLGDGTTNNSIYPEQIVASNVTAISGGWQHSLFLKSDGSLWAMGDNHWGQLGDGTYNVNTNWPEQIVASNVKAIAAGEFHSLFIKSDGSLWVMGDNLFGQLGDGTYNNTNQPEQVVASGVTAIAAGERHSLFLKSDGSLWAMGNNQDGQLGDGIYNDIYPYGTNRPVQVLAAYNQIFGQPLSGGIMRLSFVGIAGANYALDRSFSLAPPDWIPQITNPAGSFGALVFTNTLNPNTNNFWRVRSVP